MSASRIVIIDNTALVYLTHLQEHCNIFYFLRSIFTRVLIPGEIKNEYEKGVIKHPQRNSLLQKIRINSGFYALCTRYDSIALAVLKSTKGIDPGEAEAAAQHNKVGAYCIISDDNDFTKAILQIYPGIKIITSLHIIAMLELQKIVISSTEIKLKLCEIRPYKSKHLREAYQDTAKTLGLNIHKKAISKMTSLTKLKQGIV